MGSLEPSPPQQFFDLSMSEAGTLPYGPIGERAVHLCIDMQKLLARDMPWHTPWMNGVLPIVADIAERHPERTVFPRFTPAQHPDEMPGTWRRFYRRWSELTLERIN